MKNVLFSIITPVYNRADCILRCMESVSVQKKLDDIEHIIVDDGSQDTTSSIVEKYSKQHPHIKFIKFPANKGVNAARNTAIKAAKGKWCIILDSDDYFVDDALSIIHETMEERPDFKHYMFAPDDMVDYFKSNTVIQGALQKVLTFQNFLSGSIGGDFIHVCNTEILRKHPFDERLRIYEGLFFLMFYRDARQMLFTNKVVTIRERNRNDSVSKEFLRTNDSVIKRFILSNEIYLREFEEELRKYGMENKVDTIKTILLDNYILNGRYTEAESVFKTIKNKNRKARLVHTIGCLRMAVIYKALLKVFLFWKYEIKKTKM